MKLKYFLFEQAKYKLIDEIGNEIIMDVNYLENNVDLTIVKQVNEGIEELKNKAVEIGNDLLKKKHKVNFAGKFG